MMYQVHFDADFYRYPMEGKHGEDRPMTEEGIKNSFAVRIYLRGIVAASKHFIPKISNSKILKNHQRTY
jgi:hypothetical protein